MIYHSNYSVDFLWYLILRGKQQKSEKKTKTPENKVPPHFEWSESEQQGISELRVNLIISSL